MLRYKLRTLLILLAVLPPLLWFGWTKYEAWRAEQERREAHKQLVQQILDDVQRQKVLAGKVAARRTDQLPLQPLVIERQAEGP